MSKRGQIWYGDFIIGLLVIIIISVAFYYVLYDIGNANSEISELELNVESLSNGYGSWTTWSSGNKDYDGKIGLVKNSKIDVNLLTKFRNLNDYAFTKRMFGLSEYDYSAFIIDKNGVSTILAPFLADETAISNAASAIRLDRLVYYNGEIVRLNIVLFKK